MPIEKAELVEVWAIHNYIHIQYTDNNDLLINTLISYNNDLLKYADNDDLKGVSYTYYTN
jgi:hypothetical protein